MELGPLAEEPGERAEPEGVASPDQQYLEEHLEDTEESGVRSVPCPKAPTKRELEEREVSHSPFRGWSRFGVQGGPATETRR